MLQAERSRCTCGGGGPSNRLRTERVKSSSKRRPCSHRRVLYRRGETVWSWNPTSMGLAPHGKLFYGRADKQHCGFATGRVPLMLRTRILGGGRVRLDRLIWLARATPPPAPRRRPRYCYCQRSSARRVLVEGRWAPKELRQWYAIASEEAHGLHLSMANGVLELLRNSTVETFGPSRPMMRKAGLHCVPCSPVLGKRPSRRAGTDMATARTSQLGARCSDEAVQLDELSSCRGAYSHGPCEGSRPVGCCDLQRADARSLACSSHASRCMSRVALWRCLIRRRGMKNALKKPMRRSVRPNCSANSRPACSTGTPREARCLTDTPHCCRPRPTTLCRG